MLLPAVLAILLIGIYPILNVINFSLNKWDVMHSSGTFIFLKNFAYLFSHEDLWNSLKNSIV